MGVQYFDMGMYTGGGNDSKEALHDALAVIEEMAECAQEIVDILDEMGHPRAVRVRRKAQRIVNWGRKALKE